MIAEQILNTAIYNMRGITGAEVSIWSMEGTCIASTEVVDADCSAQIENFLFMGAEMQDSSEFGEVHIFNVMDEGDAAYMLMFQGLEEDSADVVGALCVCQLESLIIAYKEKVNRSSFVRQLLQGNVLEMEITQRANRLNIDLEAARVVFVVDVKPSEARILLETVRNLCGTEIHDFVLATEDNRVVLVKKLKDTDDEKTIKVLAKTIVATANTEAMLQVRVGYGNVVNSLRMIPKSYKEAMMALEVGEVFYASKRVLSYTKLGIGRLIYQLPTNICDMFLDEVLKGRAIQSFDDETMKIVFQFFQNNLNISETARQLYLHRNTLVYRLEKINKATGLDIRLFEDAMTFKIAIMVSDHVNRGGTYD